MWAPGVIASACGRQGIRVHLSSAAFITAYSASSIAAAAKIDRIKRVGFRRLTMTLGALGVALAAAAALSLVLPHPDRACKRPVAREQQMPYV